MYFISSGLDIASLFAGLQLAELSKETLFCAYIALLLNKPPDICKELQKLPLSYLNADGHKAGVYTSVSYLDFYYSEWRPRPHFSGLKQMSAEDHQC